jgi:hypothetical protein
VPAGREAHGEPPGRTPLAEEDAPVEARLEAAAAREGVEPLVGDEEPSPAGGREERERAQGRGRRRGRRTGRDAQEPPAREARQRPSRGDGEGPRRDRSRGRGGLREEEVAGGAVPKRAEAVREADRRPPAPRPCEERVDDEGVSGGGGCEDDVRRAVAVEVVADRVGERPLRSAERAFEPG